jgi:hypothetical protein
MPMVRPVSAAIVLMTLIVQAQSGLAGKWSGEEQSRAGGVPVVLQLTVNGAALTGSVIVGESPAQAIADGKTDGKQLTFRTTILMNGKEVPLLWEGVLEDNELRLVRRLRADGPSLPLIVLKRSE